MKLPEIRGTKNDKARQEHKAYEDSVLPKIKLFMIILSFIGAASIADYMTEKKYGYVNLPTLGEIYPAKIEEVKNSRSINLKKSEYNIRIGDLALVGDEIRNDYYDDFDLPRFRILDVKNNSEYNQFKHYHDEFIKQAIPNVLSFGGDFKVKDDVIYVFAIKCFEDWKNSSNGSLELNDFLDWGVKNRQKILDYSHLKVDNIVTSTETSGIIADKFRSLYENRVKPNDNVK